MDYMQRGGPLMWLILFCSVVAVAIFAERLLYFHRASINVGEFLRGLANLIERRNIAEALQECAGSPGPVPRVGRLQLSLLQRQFAPARHGPRRHRDRPSHHAETGRRRGDYRFRSPAQALGGMKLYRTPRPHPALFSLVPALNVVFLLLVF